MGSIETALDLWLLKVKQEPYVKGEHIIELVEILKDILAQHDRHLNTLDKEIGE